MIREKYLTTVKKIIGTDFRLDPDVLDQYIHHYQQFDKIRTVGPSVYYLFNNNTLRFEYISPGFVELTGFEIEEITNTEEGKFLDLIHPEDVDIIVRRVYADLRTITNKYSPADKQNLTIELSFRVNRKDGSSFRVLEQFNYLEFDHNGLPVLDFGRFTKVAARDDNSITAAIHFLHDEKFEAIFHKIYYPGLGQARISSREKEILRLISYGKTSGEIASDLFISKNTVDNHRRNLLRKLNARNTTELVRFAIGHSIY